MFCSMADPGMGLILTKFPRSPLGRPCGMLHPFLSTVPGKTYRSIFNIYSEYIILLVLFFPHCSIHNKFMLEHVEKKHVDEDKALGDITSKETVTYHVYYALCKQNILMHANHCVKICS